MFRLLQSLLTAFDRKLFLAPQRAQWGEDDMQLMLRLNCSFNCLCSLDQFLGKGNIFGGKRPRRLHNLDLSSSPASGELLLTSDFLLKEERWWFGFPSEGKQSICHDLWDAPVRHQRLRPSGWDAWFPPADSPRHDPAPMFAAPQECASPSTKTGSLASSLFIHNCKQTEAAVGVTPQLPSWLKTHLTHLLWIISPFPKSSSSRCRSLLSSVKMKPDSLWMSNSFLASIFEFQENCWATVAVTLDFDLSGMNSVFNLNSCCWICDLLLNPKNICSHGRAQTHKRTTLDGLPGTITKQWSSKQTYKDFYTQ